MTYPRLVKLQKLQITEFKRFITSNHNVKKTITMIYVVIDTNFFVARIYIISEIRKEILYMQRLLYVVLLCANTKIT